MTQTAYLISQLFIFLGIILFGSIISTMLAFVGLAINAYMIWLFLQGKTE